MKFIKKENKHMQKVANFLVSTGLAGLMGLPYESEEEKFEKAIREAVAKRDEPTFNMKIEVETEPTNNTTYYGPKSSIVFGNILPKTKTYSIDLTADEIFNNTPEEIVDAVEFEIAMEKLHDKFNTSISSAYDYTPYGIPVKEYPEFIQIGMDIIPKWNGKYILSGLTPSATTRVESTVEVFYANI